MTPYPRLDRSDGPRAPEVKGARRQPGQLRPMEPLIRFTFFLLGTVCGIILLLALDRLVR